MYSKLIEDIINEALIEPEEVEVFGSNVPKYDDSKIGYSGIMKSYFVVFKASEEGYVGVAISRENGMIRYTYSENANIGRMMHMPAMNRRAMVMEALNYLPQILYCIRMIVQKFFMRFPQLLLISQFKLQDRYHTFLLRSPEFKKLLKRFRFDSVNRQLEEIDDKEVITYTISKRSKE